MTKYLIDDELCQDLEATLQVIAGRGTPNPEVAAQLLHRLLAAVRDSTRRFTRLQNDLAILYRDVGPPLPE
jgi:hypothetical protein